MDHKIGLFSFIVGAFILLLSACGTPLPTTAGTTYASLYTKFTNGNTWTWNASNTTSIGGVPTTITASITDMYGAQVASGTQITKSYTATGAITPTITTEYIRLTTPSNNLVREDASGVVTTILPASFAVGTTYTMLTNASGTNITGTITAIDSTATVAAGTFMDVVKVNLSGSVNSGTAIGTVSGSVYLSKSAANIIYWNQINNYASGAVITTDLRELKPGYTAL